MLKRNDLIIAKMMADKDLFICGGTIKNVWEDGKPIDETVIEVTGFVLLDGLDFQVFKFKYQNTEANAKKIIEMKTKGLLKVQDMPGFNLDEMYNYRDMYFGQNLVNLGDI